jgi:hypothetical protein
MSRRGKFSLAAALVVGSLSNGGCTDTLYYGERSSFKLAIHVNDNPVTPLQVNAGVKRTVVAIAPPRGTRTQQGQQRPDGESVNLFSGFDLQYDAPQSWASPFSGTVTIKAQFASGAAASIIARNPDAVDEVVDVAGVRKILELEKTATALVVRCVTDARGNVDGPKLAAVTTGVFRPADAARYVARFAGRPASELRTELEAGLSRTAAPRMAARLDKDCRITGS